MPAWRVANEHPSWSLARTALGSHVTRQLVADAPQKVRAMVERCQHPEHLTIAHPIPHGDVFDTATQPGDGHATTSTTVVDTRA